MINQALPDVFFPEPVVFEYNLDRNWFDRQSNIFSGLSADQASQLAALVGLPSDTTFTSQDDRLAGMRYLAANPNSSLAQSALRPGAAATNWFNSSYLGGAWRHLNDGTLSSNADVIGQQMQDDLNASSSPFGEAGAFLTAFGRQTSNLFNLYTPPAPSPDQRPLDPDTILRQNNAAGEALQSFGDSSLSNYQSIGGAISRLRSSSMLANYTNLYGGQEGQARYYGTLNGLLQDQQDALQTGAPELRAAQQQGYTLSQPLEQRPELQALLQFMGSLSDQKGNISALWSGGTPMTISDILNPNGTAGARGALTRGETEAFQKIWAQQTANRQTSNDQQFQLNLSDAQQTTAASAQGGRAVEDTTTAIQAYNKAIADGLDTTKAVSQAEQLLTEKRKAADAAMQSAQDMAVKQAMALQQVTAAAGSNPVLRQAAGLEQGLQNDYQTAYIGGKTNLSYADWSSGQRRLMGIGAVQDAQNQVAGAQQSLLNAGAGPGSQDYERISQVMSGFATDLAKASTAGGDFADKVNQAANAALELSNSLARFQFESKNFDQARSTGFNASYTAMVAGAPADQRQGLQNLLPIVSQPGFNPVLNARAPLSAQTIQMIQQQGATMGLDPGLIQQALMVAQMEGAGNGSLLASNPQAAFGLTNGTLSQFGLNAPTNAASGVSDMLTILQNYSKNFPNNPVAAGLSYNTGPNNAGLQRLIASNYTDFSGLNQVQAQYANGMGIYTPQQAVSYAQNDPALAAQINASGQQRTAQTGLEISNSTSTFTAQNSADAQILALLRAGLTGQASLLQAGLNTNVLNPQLGALQAQQQVASTQFGLAKQGASNAAATDQDISNNRALGAAYEQGADAVLHLNAALQAQKEVQAGTITQQQEGARAAQLYADAISQQAKAFGQLTQQNQQSINASQYAANLPIEDSATRAQQIAQYQAYQQIDNQYTDPQMNAQAKAGYDAVAANKQLADSAQVVNDSFNQMGATIYDTLERGIESGQRFRVTLGQMALGIGEIIEKLLIEKPLEAALDSGFNSVFGTSLNSVATPGAGGGLLGFLGLGGSGAAASAGADSLTVSDAGDAIAFSAAGNVFGSAGRMQRTFATGGVFGGPTQFSDMAGGSNVAGEAGPEAILPLKTLADGSLGVATGGGGGAPITVIAHAPVTWNGGGGGNGQADPGAMKALHQQVQRATEAAVKAVILREQRPGGFLYGTIPQN